MADRYPLSPRPVADALLSSRVAGSRYVFPDLAPPRGAAWTLALAGHEECRPDYVVDRPGYPFAVVELVVAGRGEVRCGRGRTRRLGPGTLFSCAPDAPCYIRTEAAAPLVKYFFALHGREVAARLREHRVPFGTVRRIAAQAEVVAAAEDILREGGRHHPAVPALCAKLVEVLLLRVSVAGACGRGVETEDERADGSFARCKAMIDARAPALRTLEEVAASVRLDPSSVCRLFRRFQGVSPYQYLLRRKMTLAAELLLDGCVLVKEAAARVGFDDPYHFSRCFKAVHGVAPTDLRRLAHSEGRSRGLR